MRQNKGKRKTQVLSHSDITPKHERKKLYSYFCSWFFFRFLGSSFSFHFRFKLCINNYTTRSPLAMYVYCLRRCGIFINTGAMCCINTTFCPLANLFNINWDLKRSAWTRALNKLCALCLFFFVFVMTNQRIVCMYIQLNCINQWLIIMHLIMNFHGC